MKPLWISALALVLFAGGPGARASYSQSAPANLAGVWRLDFRSERNSADPQACSAP
ncbi:MAG: hypothetical protein ABJB74_14635 [Gemmatimonas sp.]